LRLLSIRLLMTPLEIAANATTALSIALAARNHVGTWPVGIVGCVLFAGLFHQQRLYADVLLQLFFIATSLLGWRAWRAGADAPGVGVRPVTSIAWSRLGWRLAVAAIVTVAYGSALYAWTDAAAPYPDSAVLAFSVVAQLLLMGRHVQTWPVWIIVNTIAVPLFASRGLWLTAALYAVYWCNAWHGWWSWQRLARKAP
jgi:nicotinamide mononucleotide transporter